MISTRTNSIFATIVFLCVPLLPLGAADCPPGSVKVAVERAGDKQRTYCECQSGYVARYSQCILSLRVDPASLVPPYHVAFIDHELDQLRARKERLSREMEKLNRLRQNQDEYMRGMEEMREQVVYDAVSDVLSIISSNEFLSLVPDLKPHDGERLAQGLKLLKVNVDSAATVFAGKDRERAREKVYDAAGGALSLAAELSLPESEREALANSIEIIAETVKAIDPATQKKGADQRDRVATTLDKVASIAGAAYKPLGVARSTVELGGSAIVAWHIRTDQEAIIEALVSSQRAKLAADQRLAATQTLIDFYETELKKVGR